MEAYGTALDGSIAVAALLFPDEVLLAEQDGIGLYDGNNKAPNHQLGSIHVSSHRLIYIDSLQPRRHSLEFDLRRITQTEFYAGFLSSSPKITLFFQPPTLPEQQQPRETTFRWECEICGNINIFTGLVPPTACQLCGVPRSANNAPQVQSSSISSEQPQSQSRSIPTSRSSLLTPGPSKSLPSSSLPTPHRVPSPATSARTGDQIGNDAQLACSACTFLNHSSLRNCEICGTALPRQTFGGPTASGASFSNRTNKSAPSSRPASPDGTREDILNREDILKVSFRRGGDKAFYAALKNALEAKVWDVVEPQIIAKNRTGIHGLVESRRTETQSAQTNIDTALGDLETLMKQAGEMVALAESFNRSLMEHEAQRQALPEDAQFIIGSSMARLGLAGPTPATATNENGKEDKWLSDLTKELATVLTGSSGPNSGRNGGLMKARGVIALDEVWGAWNRARGVALIPPSTFMQVLPLLPQYTNPPILTREFHSNLKVVHTPWYAQRAFSSRLLSFLEAAGPKTTVQVAQQESIAVGLVAEMIGSAERDGKVVRDEEGEGMGGKELRWWPNYFEGYVWDGD